MILGLTGSIGSGKTYVTQCFERLGAFIIRADELAREVIAPGTTGFQEIVTAFGTDVITANGLVDRAKLAAIVFADSARRRDLENIIHPRVHQRELELIELQRNQPLIVLEVPLLYESQSDDLCDKVLVVTVDEQIRRERLMRDRQMTLAEIEARLAGQISQEEKSRRADYVIDNSGDRETTNRAVELLFRQIVNQ